MNKNDLVDAVAERTGLAKSDAARAVEAVLGTVTDALKKNETVALSGFGSFVTKTRAARTGRNPAHRRGHCHPGEPCACVQGWQGPERCPKLACSPGARVLSSAGRATPLHGVGRGFDPLSTHQTTRSGSSVG